MVKRNFFHGVLDEENSNMHVPWLERDHMSLSLKSRDLRTGRAPIGCHIMLFISTVIVIQEKFID